MAPKLYIENIAPTTTENELKDLFSVYGNVAEVNIVLDRTYQKPRSFGFVTMVTSEGARAAIQALHVKPTASTVES
jgi:cold-inducible RNA-binding protein